MFKVKGLLSFCLLLSLLVGCKKGSPEPTIVPLISSNQAISTNSLPQSDNFESVDCGFGRPDETETPNDTGGQSGEPDFLNGRIQCGNLIVPEDRNNTTGPKIKLSVVVLKSNAEEKKPDPLLILSSGGGRSFMFNQMYDRNESDRDTVVMEQRGGGDSQANFDCPEVTDVYYTVLNQDSSSKEVLQKYLQAYRACHDRLVNSGVNLSAYTTAAIAADINDLRQALGYDQWNLYEFTYGSHLALTVMRDYPQGIRSVILDSVVPPQVDTLAEQGASAEATLNLFFQRCAEDEQCNAAFPSLKNIFYDLVSQLNAHPILMQASDLQEGKRYDILVTGDRLLEVVLASLVASYQDSLPEIPRMIFQAHDGNFLVLTDIMGRFVDELAPSSSGMQWISFCSEDAPFTSREKVANANARLDPSLTNYFTTQAETALDVCSIWNVMKAPGVTNDPITSNIPTLVLAGEFNWPAPPSWAKLAVQTLSDSSYFEFANTGQGVLYSRTWSDCSTKIVGAFLANPSAQPDGSCTQEEKKMLWITLK